jgi:hypothetical protein
VQLSIASLMAGRRVLLRPAQSSERWLGVWWRGSGSGCVVLSRGLLSGDERSRDTAGDLYPSRTIPVMRNSHDIEVRHDGLNAAWYKTSIYQT